MKHKNSPPPPTHRLNLNQKLFIPHGIVQYRGIKYIRYIHKRAEVYHIKYEFEFYIKIIVVMQVLLSLLIYFIITLINSCQLLHTHPYIYIPTVCSCCIYTENYWFCPKFIMYAVMTVTQCFIILKCESTCEYMCTFIIQKCIRLCCCRYSYLSSLMHVIRSIII